MRNTLVRVALIWLAVYPAAPLAWGATFTDIGAQAGLNLSRGEPVFLDYDKDGDEDLLLYGATASSGQFAPRLYLMANQGDGTFVDVTADAGLPTGEQGGYGVEELAVGDYDNDGDLDVFIPGKWGLDGNWHVLLLQNDGQGHFTEIGTNAGLVIPSSLLARAEKLALADFDRDGWLDCYVGTAQQYLPTSNPYPEPRPGMLFRNNRDGTFSDVSVKAGLATGIFARTSDVLLLDVDFDGDTDIYVVTRSGTPFTRELSGRQNMLWINQGDGTFVDQAEAFSALGPGLADNRAGALGVLKRGLHLFIVRSEDYRAGRNVWVYRVGNGTFTDVSSELGIGEDEPYWDVQLVDVDNDGDLDVILLGEPTSRLYLQQADGSFVDATAGSGLAPLSPRGVTLADFDRDGHVDLYVTNVGHPNALYRNTGTTGNWLEVKVVKSDQHAFGVLLVEESTSSGSGCCQLFERFGHGGDSPYLHIGIDKQKEPVVKITWPDGNGGGGNLVRYFSLLPNHRLTLAENEVATLDPIGDKTVDEGKLLQFKVVAQAPQGARLLLTARLANGDLLETVGATFSDHGDATGTFAWTPTFEQAGTYLVTFDDEYGWVDTSETVTITVRNVNRPPVLSPIGNKTVTEGRLLSFRVTATDPDGTPLLYRIANTPAGATLDMNTGAFSWTPSFTQAGSYKVTFYVSDGQFTLSETITITVLNDADRDGFADTIEQFIGTDPSDACPDHTADAAWPPDFNNDRQVTLRDVGTFIAHLNTRSGDANYSRRHDLNADGKVTMTDVALLIPYFNTGCTN